MSNSNIPLSCVSVMEPRLELNRERIFVITKGAGQVTYIGYPSNNWSNNQFSFTANPPASTNVLDRQVYIEVPYTIRFSANPNNLQPGRNILQPGRDALRCCPLSMITQTLTANFNGFPVNVDLNQVIPALTRYNCFLKEKRGLMSTQPSAVDNCQRYSDMDGLNCNPLADYVNASYMSELPRGAYEMTVTNAEAVAPGGVPNVAIVTGVLRECLILPPFLWQGEQAPGITNLTSLTFQWVLSSNLARLWSHSDITDVGGQSIIGNVSVNLSNPTLWVGWLEPRLTQPIAPKLTYPYARVTRNSQELGPPVLAGARYTGKSPVLQIDSVPSKIYVYVRQSEALTNANIRSQITTPDSFFRIEKFIFNWGVNTNLFAGASMKNMYDISVSNGYNRTWTEFNGISQRLSGPSNAPTLPLALEGPVICIVPGKDFGLPDDVAESVNGQWQYQFELSVQNIHPTATYTPEIVIITVNDGTMVISNGTAVSQSAPLTRADVMNAPLEENINYNQLQSVYGGDFFNKFKGFLGDVNSFLKKYKPISTIAKQVPNSVGQTVGRVADALGYGLYSGPQSEYAPQGEYEGRGVMAGAFGGRKLSKAELKKRLGHN